MPTTKQRTALVLAAAALAQTIAYEGYRWVNPPLGGQKVDFKDYGISDEQLRQYYEEGPERARRRLQSWKENPQAADNPEWRIAQILQGRAPDDPSLSEVDKVLMQPWLDMLQEEKDVAAGKRLPSLTTWLPKADINSPWPQKK
jgi:hypothetical protein